MPLRTLVNHIDPFQHIIWCYYAQKRPKTVFLALTRSLVEQLYSNPVRVGPLTRGGSCVRSSLFVYVFSLFSLVLGAVVWVLS